MESDFENWKRNQHGRVERKFKNCVTYFTLVTRRFLGSLVTNLKSKFKKKNEGSDTAELKNTKKYDRTYISGDI